MQEQRGPHQTHLRDHPHAVPKGNIQRLDGLQRWPNTSLQSLTQRLKADHCHLLHLHPEPHRPPAGLGDDDVDTKREPLREGRAEPPRAVHVLAAIVGHALRQRWRRGGRRLPGRQFSQVPEHLPALCSCQAILVGRGGTTSVGI